MNFLRDEVRSKGKIIDLLLENSVLRDSQNFPLQNRHINFSPQVSNFEFPKRRTNVKYNENSNTLITKNRFEALSNNNDLDANQDEFNIIDNNEITTQINSRRRNKKKHVEKYQVMIQLSIAL